jgi:DNA-binding transcriptional ArsR family regulator
LTKRQELLTLFGMEEDDVAPVTTPEQFKALGHPMRHRLLFALGQGQATISQLAAALGSNKGNIAHHLKVLAEAGLVRPAGTRQVRGGTEQYYQRASRGLKYDNAATTDVAFRALAAEIAAAEPDPFLVLRTLRLTPEHAKQLTATLRDLAHQAEDTSDQPRYGLLLGLYQPAQPSPPHPAPSAAPATGPPAAGEPGNQTSIE